MSGVDKILEALKPKFSHIVEALEKRPFRCLQEWQQWKRDNEALIADYDKAGTLIGVLDKHMNSLPLAEESALAPPQATTPPNPVPEPSPEPKPEPVCTPQLTEQDYHAKNGNWEASDLKDFKSAGALLFRRDPELGKIQVLLPMEYRESDLRWHVFGGMRDPGETPLQTASREFFEEIGELIPRSTLEKWMQKASCMWFHGGKYCLYLLGPPSAGHQRYSVLPEKYKKLYVSRYRTQTMEASQIDWVDASILDPETTCYNNVNTSGMLKKLKVSSVFQGLRGEIEASLPPAPAAPPPQSHGANEPQKPSMRSHKSEEQPKIKNEQPEPPAIFINTHQEISSQFGSVERHSDPQDHQASGQAAQQSSHQEAPRKPVNTQSSHHANGHSKREAFKVQAAPVQRTVSKWEPHIVHSYRSAGVLLGNDNFVLLSYEYRLREGLCYHLLGGGRTRDEIPEETVVRKLNEESGGYISAHAAKSLLDGAQPVWVEKARYCLYVNLCLSNHQLQELSGINLVNLRNQKKDYKIKAQSLPMFPWVDLPHLSSGYSGVLGTILSCHEVSLLCPISLGASKPPANSHENVAPAKSIEIPEGQSQSKALQEAPVPGHNGQAQSPRSNEQRDDPHDKIRQLQQEKEDLERQMLELRQQLTRQEEEKNTLKEHLQRIQSQEATIDCLQKKNQALEERIRLLESPQMPEASANAKVAEIASDTNKEAEQLNLPPSPTWPPGQRDVSQPQELSPAQVDLNQQSIPEAMGQSVEEEDLMDTSDCQPVHDQSHSSDNPPDSAQHDPHPEQDDPMETEPKEPSQPPNDQPSSSDVQDNLNSVQPQSVAPEGLPVPTPGGESSGEPDEMKQE